MTNLSINHGICNNSFNLLIPLQMIIVVLFFWTNEHLDSDEEVSPDCKENFKSYYKTLTRLSKDCSAAVMKYIKTYTRERNAPNRPNIHCLLEPVFHTVNLFGHGRLVFQLIMDIVHEIWTSWMETDKHTLTFISRLWMLVCAANGLWMYIPTTLCTRLENLWIGVFLKEVCFNVLWVSLLHVDRSSDVKLKQELQTFRKAIHVTMEQPVLNMLRVSLSVNFLWS